MTNETAKRLREEIATYFASELRRHWKQMDSELSNSWEFEAGINEAIHFLVNDEGYINKVLDAAVESLGANYHNMPREKETTGVKLHNSVVTANIEVINKLRP